jgi:murein DD-endopeptidase MepM/ murein hydrolase activator NlpD
VRRGEKLAAGDSLGRVGRTGDASACHLHFEMWSSPGWEKGGSLIDPLPYLKRWDRR